MEWQRGEDRNGNRKGRWKKKEKNNKRKMNKKKKKRVMTHAVMVDSIDGREGREEQSVGCFVTGK